MRAIIITGKLATDREVWYPIYRLEEEGAQVSIAVRNKETVLGVVGEKIVPTMDIPDPMANGYDLLILPGGARAMEYLRQDTQVLAFIRHFHDSGGVIGSICHAAQLLISAGLATGRRISGYYSIRDDIVNAGGTYVDEPCVIDGRIITSAHYKHLGPWMAGVLKVAREHKL